MSSQDQTSAPPGSERGSLFAEPRPILDRWASKVGSPARWSDPDKCLLVQGILFFAAITLANCVAFLDGWPFWTPFEHDLQRSLLGGVLAVMAVWPVLMVVTILARRKGRVPRPWLVQATCYYYALNIAWFGYITGPFHAAGAFAILGGMVIGMMLFRRRVVLMAFVVYSLGLLLIGHLCHSGVLPYEPVYLQAVGERGLSPQWLGRMTVGSILLGGLILVVLALIVESWRYREVKLERASQHDALTGVLNRGRLMYLAQRAFVSRGRSDKVAAVMVDVDHFKRVNDRYGHLVGDDVLRRVAAGLHGVLRRADILGRYGGEEFLIVLPDSSEEDAVRVAERCLELLRGLRFEDHPDLRISASFGVAARPPLMTDSLDALMTEADAALYIAKKTGRNRVIVAGRPVDDGDAGGERRVAPVRPPALEPT